MSGLAGYGKKNRTLQTNGLYCNDHLVLDKNCNLTVVGVATVDELITRNGAVVCGSLTGKNDLIIQGNLEVSVIEGGGGGGSATLAYAAIGSNGEVSQTISFDTTIAFDKVLLDEGVGVTLDAGVATIATSGVYLINADFESEVDDFFRIYINGTREAVIRVPKIVVSLTPNHYSMHHMAMLNANDTVEFRGDVDDTTRLLFLNEGVRTYASFVRIGDLPV